MNKKITKTTLLLGLISFVSRLIKNDIQTIFKSITKIEGIFFFSADNKLKDILLHQLKLQSFSIYGSNKIEEINFEFIEPIQNHTQYSQIKTPSNKFYFYSRGYNEHVNNIGSAVNPFYLAAEPLINNFYFKIFYNINVHFELFGNFNTNKQTILSHLEVLPIGSTLILTSSLNNSLNLIDDELIIMNFYHYSRNPYVQYIKFLIINPSFNLFAVNIKEGIEEFTSNPLDLLTFSDKEIMDWQKRRISEFLSFVLEMNKTLRFDGLLLGYNDTMTEKMLASGIGLESLQTIYLPRYKELLLFNYIALNQSTKFDSLIKTGVNINSKLYNGETLLHISASLDNIQITELLIKYGANVNEASSNKATPLMLSSFFNCINTTGMLLNSGANVNAVDINKNTALHLSVLKGNQQITEQLLNFSADVNSKNKVQATPLLIAINSDDVYLVKLLLDYSADINILAAGTFPILAAISMDSIVMVRLLLSYAPNIINVTTCVYENAIDTIQSEILIYKYEPVLYVLRHQHNSLSAFKALSNLELYNQYEGIYNITDLKSGLAEADSYISYLNLLQPYNINDNKECDIFFQSCNDYYHFFIG